MRWIMRMDCPTRLAVGLLAWPAMVFLAILLSYAAQPGPFELTPAIAVLAFLEVLATAVAIVFPVWALLTWDKYGDDWDAQRP